MGQQLEKYGDLGRGKNSVLCLWLQYTYFFFKIYKEVFNVQGVWPSPNILPTMVHGQAFYIITLTTENEMETPLLGTLWAALWVEPWESFISNQCLQKIGV